MNKRILSLSFLLPLALSSACSDEKPKETTAEPPPPLTAEPPAPKKVDDIAPKPAVLASGVIELPKDAKAKGKLVFVSLRGVGGRGPPIAAQRLPAGPFPMAFEITEANVVAMGGAKRPVPDEFVLKVTLDEDGNPMQKSPGDFVITQQTKKGTSKMKLVLAPAK